MSIKEINDTFSIWAREYQKMPDGEEKKKFKVQMDIFYNKFLREMTLDDLPLEGE